MVVVAVEAATVVVVEVTAIPVPVVVVVVVLVVMVIAAAVVVVANSQWFTNHTRSKRWLVRLFCLDRALTCNNELGKIALLICQSPSPFDVDWVIFQGTIIHKRIDSFLP